jgi:hypothetical protein
VLPGARRAVLVSEDIRAETTRALSAPPVWKAHAAGGLLKRDANALLEVASQPLALATIASA